jgi:hypothetical protein
LRRNLPPKKYTTFNNNNNSNNTNTNNNNNNNHNNTNTNNNNNCNNSDTNTNNNNNNNNNNHNNTNNNTKDHINKTSDKTIDIDDINLCYIITMPDRPGKFDAQKAKSLGVLPGPSFGLLTKGMDYLLIFEKFALTLQ